MKVLDVNVLVNAFRDDLPGHESALAVLADARQSAESFIVLPEVAIGFVRIVTRRDLLARPDEASSAMEALDAWCSAPNFRVQEAGPGRWPNFVALMLDHELVGGDVHDGLLAAACIDFGATLVTSDRGFSRFAGLRVQLV